MRNNLAFFALYAPNSSFTFDKEQDSVMVALRALPARPNREDYPI